MLVVGEASGDVHGAHLVDALHEKDARAENLRRGRRTIATDPTSSRFSVSRRLTGMGLVELAGNLKNLWRAYSTAQAARCDERRPNLLMLIDFPEFNLRLARLAKSLRVPVLYYISPQIWAWRKGRVKPDRALGRSHGGDVSVRGAFLRDATASR